MILIFRLEHYANIVTTKFTNNAELIMNLYIT